MLRRGYCLLAVVLLLSALPVYAQENTPALPFATVTNNQLVLYGFGETPTVIQTPPAASYNNLVWSPDGNTLAFTQFDPNTFHSLMFYTLGQPSATLILSQLGTSLPIGFTPDGTQLIYAFPTGQTTADMMGSIYQVESVALAAGAVPQPIGQFVFSVGCGGGSSFPGDHLYWTESNGFGGNSLTLMLTPFGLVHSTTCMGQGISLLDLATGTDLVLDTTLSRAVVSPDRTQVVGVNGNGGLSLINLQTREIIPLAATATPDQIAWGAPGSGDVFYSTRVPSGRQLVEGEAERLAVAQAFGYMDATMLDLPIWEVTIHRYNLLQNTDTQVYAGEAYAVGRMSVTPDSGTLLFSQIPNGQAWIQAILDGSLAQMSEGGVDLIYVTLFSLNLSDNSVGTVGTHLNQAALNTAIMSQ